MPILIVVRAMMICKGFTVIGDSIRKVTLFAEASIEQIFLSLIGIFIDFAVGRPSNRLKRRLKKIANGKEHIHLF